MGTRITYHPHIALDMATPLNQFHYIGANYQRVNLFGSTPIQPLPVLSKEFFLSTMASGMENVTETAQPVVDIWQWAPQLVAAGLIPQYIADKNLVESVHRNQSGTYEHVLLPTGNENIFICIIIDLAQRKAAGYHVLDLEVEYGLK